MLGRSLLMKASGARLLYPAYVQDYLDRVTAADVAAGNTLGLERGVTDGFNVALQDLVADTSLGISGSVIAQAASKIKAMPFMCGARTLPGCLVPVVGPALTGINLVPADYSRKGGVKGNIAAAKSINTNYAIPVENRDNVHSSAWCSEAMTAKGNILFGNGIGNGVTAWAENANAYRVGANQSPASLVTQVNIGNATGFIALNRSSPSQISYVISSAAGTALASSIEPFAATVRILSGTQYPCDARVAFYSIGESLDLAILGARISTLMNTLSAVLP